MLNQEFIKQPYKHIFCFECLGVRVAIGSNRKEILEKLKKQVPLIIPIKWRETAFENIKSQYNLLKNAKTGKYSLSESELELGQENVLTENINFRGSLDLIASKIRLTIAEFSEEKIFLHAGVIGLKKSAVIIPGKSFAGKTTLVAEFVKRGYAYFSDEYALIDRKGLVHPFPKKLSMRGIIDDYRQVDLDVEHFGGKRALKPMPVGYILLTEYKKGNSSKLKETSAGEGVMTSIANSISVRQNPKLVIEVLNKIALQSRILKGKRGEASEFVDLFLKFIDDFLIDKDS